jgi:hypothetical protein
MIDWDNGFARNLRKLKHEFLQLYRFMGPHFMRWIKKPWDSHAYVNLFVESRRLTPYLMGHIDAVLYPALIIAWAWASFL